MDTMKEENYCPRCIEDWEDDDGVPHKGTEEVSACEECGVCIECEHLCDCSKAN